MPSQLVHVPKTASSTLIKQSPLFNSLPADVVTAMTEHFWLQNWKKNELIAPDILLTRFHYILDGQLEYKRSNPDTGREVSIDMHYPGDSFDIVTLLDGRPHDVIVSPITDLRVISIPIAMMRKWIWTYPELNHQFLPYFAQKMREYENQASSFVLYDIQTRISRVILKHLNKMHFYRGNSNDAHKEHLINGLSDDVLARMAGSVRQVVNKQLQHWQAQGVLNKKRNQIMINDLEVLAKEAKQTASYY
jgi:CRP/FNR family cyclic AMP-dependent transcriptional regulator